MRPPRGLSPEEAALWARVAGTVTPLRKNPPPVGEVARAQREPVGASVRPRPAPSTIRSAHGPPPPKGEDRKGTPPSTLDRHGLDGSWERKLAKAQVSPDFTLDLHGHSLDAAHRRLDHGLALAVAQHARVVLVITGRPRPVDAADRGSRRGAIRAKLVDWLAAGPHASKIAAIRPAHQRHGGAGAVYVVMKRAR